MRKRILFLLICSGLIAAPFSAAQTQPSDDNLETIKAQITDRLAENRRLQQENVRLGQEYERLKVEHEGHLREAEAAADEEREKMASLQHELDTRQDVGHSLQEMETDLAVKAAQITHLNGWLNDLEQQERLWKLKTADVEYQKQTLQLESALKQYQDEAVTGVDLAKIEELNRAILANRLEEKELLTQYSLLEDEAKILLRQKEIFEQENVYLQKEAGEYSDLRKQTTVEADNIQLTRAAQEESLTQALEEKQQQKEELQKKLQALQEQYQTFDEQLNETLKQLEERGRLITEIIALKEDNARLQSAIAGLQSQAKEFTP